MNSLKTKIITTETGKYLYKYRGGWKNPVIYSMEVLPLSYSKLSENFDHIIQITDHENF